jgi:hypothetical protein
MVNMLWINDKLYTYYDHFLEQIEQRRIAVAWVEEVLLEPDDLGYSKSTGRYWYEKFIEAAKQKIRVVVDEDESMIVTAHYVDD